MERRATILRWGSGFEEFIVGANRQPFQETRTATGKEMQSANSSPQHASVSQKKRRGTLVKSPARRA
jgi:hypothetical protein